MRGHGSDALVLTRGAAVALDLHRGDAGVQAALLDACRVALWEAFIHDGLPVSSARGTLRTVLGAVLSACALHIDHEAVVGAALRVACVALGLDGACAEAPVEAAEADGDEAAVAAAGPPREADIHDAEVLDQGHVSAPALALLVEAGLIHAAVAAACRHIDSLPVLLPAAEVVAAAARTAAVPTAQTAVAGDEDCARICRAAAGMLAASGGAGPEALARVLGEAAAALLAL